MQLEGCALRSALAFLANSPVRAGGFCLLPRPLRWNLLRRLSISRPRRRMAYTAILNRIRLLIPAELDGHYKSIRRSFEAGDLTAPSLSISEMQLARAISEFTSFPPNEASIETLEKRLNPKY
jgi:hypothetical protein